MAAAPSSYAAYFEIYRQQHPDWTRIEEGQTPEVAGYEQQLFLLWLQPEILHVKSLLPKSSFYCRTDETKTSIDSLAREVISRIQHLQGFEFALPGAYEAYFQYYNIPGLEWDSASEQKVFLHFLQGEIATLNHALPANSFYCSTQRAHDALTALYRELYSRIAALDKQLNY